MVQRLKRLSKGELRRGPLWERACSRKRPYNHHLIRLKTTTPNPPPYGAIVAYRYTVRLITKDVMP